MRATLHPRARAGGFSLIEVMVAMLVLGIGIAGLTEGIATGLRSMREAQLHSSATLYAAGLIETLRAEGLLTDGTTEGECGAGLSSHRWRTTIARTDLDGLHDVTVVVEQERTGKAVCELRTLLFEPPTGELSTNSVRGNTGGPARRDRERRR